VPAPNVTRRAVWASLLVLATAGCTSVDPGPNFSVEQPVFNADYFYCHVEPELIFAKSCGSGDSSQGDPNNGCHFNPAAVSGMQLQNHQPVDCGGGDHPIDTTQVGTGSAPQQNLITVSEEMSRDYTSAPLFLRPSSVNGQPPSAHPRAIFDQNDPQVNQLLATWASK